MEKTREELLEGLRYVNNLITKIVAVQNEQVRIVDAYRKEETGISTEGFQNRTKYVAVIIGAAATLFYLITGVVSGAPFMFLWFLVPFALAVRAWMKNRRGKKILGSRDRIIRVPAASGLDGAPQLLGHLHPCGGGGVLCHQVCGRQKE